jgi:hypothetical protein
VNFNRATNLEYTVTLYQRNVEPMCTWCLETFGKRFAIVDRDTFGQDGVWQCMYRGLPKSGPPAYEFLFVREADAIMFKLKWA